MADFAGGTIARNCARCARRVSAVVAERLDGGTLHWSETGNCAHCDFTHELDGIGWPDHDVRTALMRQARVRVRIGPEKLPRAIVMRRLGALLHSDLVDVEAYVNDLFAGTFEATPVEAAMLRDALPHPFRVTVTETEPLPAVVVPPHEIQSLAEMWTTEKTHWVLHRVGAGFLPIDLDGGVRVIEDDTLATEVIARMAEAGVPIVDPGSEPSGGLADE